MKKLVFVAGMLTVSTAPVGAAEANEVNICKVQDQRCTEVCDLDKILWFYEGEAYENCRQQCDDEIEACLAADLDVDEFEVILPRSAYSEREVPEKPSLDEYEIETGTQ